MKILKILLLLLGLLQASSLDSLEDPYKNILYTKLDNGMQVYILSDSKTVNTKIDFEVAVGTDIETNENYGISHLVEHMVFRDQRVPHRDYLDYFKEEGASYVNAYTSRYETEYRVEIDSNKSYWIVESFARMMFDKNITQKDLESERGAVQVELGNYRWIEKLGWQIQSFMKKISPPEYNVYLNDFSINKLKELPPSYQDKINNQNFTMQDVMKHYKTYYYPENMVLTIVGNFDAQKMQAHIKKIYNKIDIKGNKKAVLPPNNATLNHKPYYNKIFGTRGNQGYIGAKYILDDYKKYMILDAYIGNLALRLQQELRNDLGKVYSINSSHNGQRNGYIATISFGGLHADFEKNKKVVENTLQDDMINISDKTIDEALKEYSKNYTSIEHDSSSLLSIISLQRYLKEEHHTDKTPIDILKSITKDDFKKVIQNTFIKENSYQYITKDYHFFVYDKMLMGLLILILVIWVYFHLHLMDRTQNNRQCSNRDVHLKRRVSNRFLGFLSFMLLMIVAGLLWEWSKYLFLKYILNNLTFIQEIDGGSAYIWFLLDSIVSILLMILVARHLFSYWAKLEVTEDLLCLTGYRRIAIEKSEIQTIELEKWSIVKSVKSYGISLFFWRSLVKLHLNNGKIYYLRSKNAKHLEEDLLKWFDS